MSCGLLIERIYGAKVFFAPLGGIFGPFGGIFSVFLAIFWLWSKNIEQICHVGYQFRGFIGLECFLPHLGAFSANFEAFLKYFWLIFDFLIKHCANTCCGLSIERDYWITVFFAPLGWVFGPFGGSFSVFWPFFTFISWGVSIERF